MEPAKLIQLRTVQHLLERIRAELEEKRAHWVAWERIYQGLIKQYENEIRELQAGDRP